jgi:F0F1-type ATP synthase membrane subunit c/vacuolar-type H+-ATPase subunit K
MQAIIFATAAKAAAQQPTQAAKDFWCRRVIE